ncbi:MAG TPA: hypothetical protein VMB66_02145 [Candidatus Acidoferrales bacterium]|nr:hypothetical protein [Candidatus Acidoferrales bacterium]
MTRVEYERSVCDRLANATRIPFRPVSFADGTAPMVGGCHRNADRWVTENPDCDVVRGWVTYSNFGVSIGLTAHSVVRDQDGQVFDITPLENERYRAGMQFVPHVGRDQVFLSMKESNLFIQCPIPNELDW